jgi:hypothetical protein
MKRGASADAPASSTSSAHAFDRLIDSGILFRDSLIERRFH